MQETGLVGRIISRVKVADANNHAIVRLRCFPPRVIVARPNARRLARLYAPLVNRYARRHVSPFVLPNASRNAALALHAAQASNNRHQDPRRPT